MFLQKSLGPNICLTPRRIILWGISFLKFYTKIRITQQNIKKTKIFNPLVSGMQAGLNDEKKTGGRNFVGLSLYPNSGPG